MSGPDWERVRRELRDAGYPGFEFDAGETAVPGLSGEWVIGEVEREGRLRRGAQPWWIRLLDALPGGSAVTTDPAVTPKEMRDVADRHGLTVVIVSVGDGTVRIAVCDPAEHDQPPGDR
jgi:hypothetical protein